ncbi:MAG: DUF1194 domain-containing protein [Arhodomonas sp.]|nr:DUF1194 domain-containing protein [Arhodomonas sp.]
MIDVSTDGRSSQGAAERAAADARDAGIDTLNAIGVGSGIDEGLLEAIVFPKPPRGRRGFVELIDEYAGYEEAIFAKVDREVRVIDLTVRGPDRGGRWRRRFGFRVHGDRQCGQR